MTELDEKKILYAIKEGVDRLPQATEENPFPAKGINLVIDAGDLATEENAEALRSKYSHVFEDLEKKLGYQRLALVNVQSGEVVMIFGEPSRLVKPN